MWKEEEASSCSYHSSFVELWPPITRRRHPPENRTYHVLVSEYLDLCCEASLQHTSAFTCIITITHDRMMMALRDRYVIEQQAPQPRNIDFWENTRSPIGINTKKTSVFYEQKVKLFYKKLLWNSCFINYIVVLYNFN